MINLSRDVSSHNAAPAVVNLPPVQRTASPYLRLPPTTTMREPGSAYATVFSLAKSPTPGSSNPRTMGRRTVQPFRKIRR